MENENCSSNNLKFVNGPKFLSEFYDSYMQPIFNGAKRDKKEKETEKPGVQIHQNLAVTLVQLLYLIFEYCFERILGIFQSYYENAYT